MRTFLAQRCIPVRNNISLPFVWWLSPKSYNFGQEKSEEKGDGQPKAERRDTLNHCCQFCTITEGFWGCMVVLMCEQGHAEPGFNCTKAVQNATSSVLRVIKW